MRNDENKIDYIIRMAESVGIHGVGKSIPLSFEICAEIMQRLQEGKKHED